MKRTSLLWLLITIPVVITSCKKDDDPAQTETEMTAQELQSAILNDFSSVTVFPAYQDMETKMNDFHNACMAFNTTQSQSDLDNAKQAWKNVRGVWEQSEAFLFGPVSTENIDPSTDTWPVDYNSLDSVLTSGNAFTASYITSLGDELKGYHPSEYLLWGLNSSKSAAQFTQREKEYLVALSADLQMKANQLRNSWDPAMANNYSHHVKMAGDPTSVYPSQKAAFEEIVTAMAGICDEVANGKITEPFVAADPTLEESPYSSNSITDFKNNITGVQNVYFGKYNADGYGLENLVKKYNLSLHNKIVNQLDNAINSFNGITVPFGQAITSQPTQVQNTIDRINELKTTLEDELLPFVQQYVQ